MYLNSNKVLIDIKAPYTSKEFGNIYDSWYATHELGKYYLSNQYNEIPGTLWTKILKDYPEINDLKGRELSEKKKNIIINTFIANPENYVIGSFLQIYNFFNKSKDYIERFDNTSGFLFIDFYHYRILILLLFLLGGLFSLFYFIKFKENYMLLVFFIFIGTLLSQPFILGGEARTPATVIFFLNLVVISAIKILMTNIYYYKSNFVKDNVSFENIKSSGIFSLLCFPLSFFYFLFL